VPNLIAARQTSKEVSIGMQAVIITLTSFACQLLRRKPLTELLREFNVLWVKQLCLGGLIGSALMLVPALILGISGWVKWQFNTSISWVFVWIFAFFSGLNVHCVQYFHCVFF
jgi:hypothetical protein